MENGERFLYKQVRFFYLISGIVAGICLLLLTTCQSNNLFSPPRFATQTAEALQVHTPTPLETVVAPQISESLAGTPLSPVANPHPVVTLWIDETSKAHVQLLAEMAEQFNQNYDAHLEVIHVNPDLLPALMRTAILSNTLPDLVLHPLDFSFGWYAEGVLDGQATQEVVESLGADTFDPDALALLQEPDTGQQISLPSNGWKQLLIYRQDWFEALNLQPPVDYTAIFTAAAQIYNPEQLISGLVIPTESDLPSTARIFEQFALANGCELIDNKGELQIAKPACQHAFNFYRNLVNGYSPSDVQTDTSALNTYLEGRTGFIIGPPSLLPFLAGLDVNHPPECPECVAQPDYLAQNSGYITTLNGDGNQAQLSTYSQITVLSITTAADQAAAQAFAQYWFEEGYLLWLGVEPERKVPLRQGTVAEPTKFMQAWKDALPVAGTNQTLTDLFGAELVEQLSAGIAQTNRWGIPQGQGALISQLTEEMIMPIILQEMLSGYFTSDQTAVEAFNRTVAFIPNYPYELLPTPTPTPTPTD